MYRIVSIIDDQYIVGKEGFSLIYDQAKTLNTLITDQQAVREYKISEIWC